MQRFFVEPFQVLEEEHRITLTGPDLNHMKNVLRMRIGEDVWISDGSEKEYHCTIEEFQEDSAVLHILYAQESQYELPSRIYLFQGLPKGDKMELIIQKAVELGAYAVVPVETRRCVVKLDAKKAQKKVTRWQQISESAAKQSKRMLIPEVKNVMSWKEALAFAKGLDVILIPYELAKGMKETREILSAIQPGQSVGIFIGPEGGFAEEESRKLLAPLITENVSSIVKNGCAKALTGPVERADVQTVKNHLAALQGSDEEAVYRSISKKLTALAKCRNPQRDYTALERIMDEKYSTDL